MKCVLDNRATTEMGISMGVPRVDNIIVGVAINKHSSELGQLVFISTGVLCGRFTNLSVLVYIVGFVCTLSNKLYSQVCVAAMEPIMDVIKNSGEPEWLEEKIIGELRVWQVIFLCLAGLTSLIVMVCCCFRFRIPRTKQQIEADYQRRKITTKFRQQLETIQDNKMDAMSLKDALELLHEKSQTMDAENQQGSQASSIMSQQQSSLEGAFQPEGGQKPEPQVSGMNFVKFATKVANLSKLTQPKSPTSPTPSGNKMDF